LLPGAGELRVGTFIKTNAVQQIEILGSTPLHFVVIDAEHAPFDRGDIDTLVLAGRAVGLPVLVRIPDRAPSTILSVLDCGASGLLVPHVDSPDDALEVVSRARCRGGSRGFSSSTRAAGYGSLNMRDALSAVDDVVVVAQIESRSGVESAQQIAAVDGIAGLFVGRADLALSMDGDDPRSEVVLAATRRTIRAALAARKLAGMAVGNAAERDEFAKWGANWFVVGSDQSLLRQAGQAIAVA
jgi:2-keto-3-deoxy-L-rhamnonate aldolase RhmA